MNLPGEALLGVYVDPASRTALALVDGVCGGADGEGAEQFVSVQILPAHSARFAKEQAMPHFFALVHMPNCRLSSVFLRVRLYVKLILELIVYPLC